MFTPFARSRRTTSTSLTFRPQLERLESRETPDATICLVAPMPGNPAVPRLDLTLLSSPAPQAHAGDQTVIRVTKPAGIDVTPPNNTELLPPLTMFLPENGPVYHHCEPPVIYGCLPPQKPYEPVQPPPFYPDGFFDIDYHIDFPSRPAISAEAANGITVTFDADAGK